MITWDQVAAFGDEAAEDLGAQIKCLEAEGIRWIEFRNAWGKSVVQLTEPELRLARASLDAAGVGVSAIGSPAGKTDVHSDWSVTAEVLKRSMAAAAILGTRLVRVFSFYVVPGREAAARDRVLDHMSRMTILAEAQGLVLLHENEKDIYGDTPERCLDLLTEVASPSLGACFDPANFIQVGCRSVPDAWRLLAPLVHHVHVKDARQDGSVTPAGEGAGEWPWLMEQLRHGGYAGFLSLEPHLDADETRSGCERLGVAADALRRLVTANADVGPT